MIRASSATARLFLALGLTSSVACSRYELPKPPEPLPAINASETPTDVQVDFNGAPEFTGEFQVVGEITQYSLKGPPLRLRVEIDVVTKAGGTATIIRRRVAPNDLAAVIKLPKEGAVILKDVWPLTVLGALNQPQELRSWLNRSMDLKGCAPKETGVSNHELSTGRVDAGWLFEYKTLKAGSDDRRNEITGFVRTDETHQVLDLNLKTRRWARLTGSACDLVQNETVAINFRPTNQ
jgi:hypothetical protein